MAITNKWKTSFNETPSVSEDQVLDTFPNDTSNDITIRSDWTMQRKMGVAMGVVGAILVLVGIAPMVIDTDTLKGDVMGVDGEASEGAPDPLVSLLMGGGAMSTTDPTSNDSNETSSTSEETNPDPLAKILAGNSIPTSTTAPERVITETIVLNTENTENSGMTSSQTTNSFENTTVETALSMNNNFESTSIESENNPLQNEVNNIISTANTTTFNTNTGVSDTIGAEFMTENTSAIPLISTDNSTLHGAAPLQNTTSATNSTQLTNSGPADTALILFILSLFMGGGVRYFRKL